MSIAGTQLKVLLVLNTKYCWYSAQSILSIKLDTKMNVCVSYTRQYGHSWNRFRSTDFGIFSSQLNNDVSTVEQNSVFLANELWV
jgi:hypothetical protein